MPWTIGARVLGAADAAHHRAEKDGPDHVVVGAGGGNCAEGAPTSNVLGVENAVSRSMRERTD